MMDVIGKKVTVIGAGKSGQAAVRLLVQQKAHVKLSEGGSAQSLTVECLDLIRRHNIELEVNGHTPEFIKGSELLVISPGVRIDAPVVRRAKDSGIPVIGEIELASWFCKQPMIAVTGSNGKTTVTTLIGLILEKAGKKVRVCGNIGNPFCDNVIDTSGVDFFVLEISSFQLETIVNFKPHVALFLNFSQNHLDRHADINEYFTMKRRIFLNQDQGDYAVLNAGQDCLREIACTLKSQTVFFNEEFSCNKESQSNGRINNPNHLAVLAVAEILGINSDLCLDVFKQFSGVEHRLERVRVFNGIEFINDSKATTAEASRWAMENIQKPIIMICGGKDKNIDFSVLSDVVHKKVKDMIVIGDARQKLKKTFSGIVDVQECHDLQEAVRQACKVAAPGDCVLLSPMCASFDMFKNFEERGQVFKKIVRELQ